MSQPSAARIATVYAITGLLWIVFSDRLTAGAWPVVQTYKGMGFVLVTASVLYLYLRRLFAQQRRARQELEALNEAKARLVAAVGHDLRQPLQSLALFASVIEASATDPRSREAVRHLQASVERMGAMLGAILELAKLDMGMHGGKREPVRLRELMQALATEMEPQAAAKGLRLRFVPCGLVVCSDYTLLSTILRNLIANAIRYTDQGGVLVGCRRKGDGLLLAVYDTGAGIPADRLKLIFEEFYQLGNPSRDITQGLGLGLAIVDRIARVLGYAVEVRSTEGKGSMFAVKVRRD